MLLQKNVTKWISYGFICLSLLVGLNVAVKRHIFESHNNAVELAISYDEVKQLAARSGLGKSKLLSMLSRETKITSIALEEDTIGSLENEAKITILKGSDILNMLRVGKVYRTILTHIAKTTGIIEDRIYLIIDEHDTYEQVKNHLRVSLESDSIKERGWNILDVQADLEALLEIGAGLSQEKLKEIRGYGFNIIPRYKNNDLMSDTLVKLKLQNLSQNDDIKTIIFEGKSVLGYPSELSLATSLIKRNQLNVGYIEFSNQLGADTVISTIPKSVIKVHSITKKEMEQLSEKDTLSRYLRAAKERGARILFLHPHFDYNGTTSLAKKNIAFFNDVTSHLEELNFKVGILRKLPVQHFQPINMWEWVTLCLGLFVWIILFIEKFTPLRLKSILIALTLYILLLTVVFLTKSIPFWNMVFALIVSIIFPTYCMVSFFPLNTYIKSTKKRAIASISFISKVVGVSLIGALFIISFYSDLPYLLSIYHFYGVKISFLLPLFFIGVYFYLKPHRLSSFHYVLKRLFIIPINTGSLLAVLLCMIIIGLYILRSGNYVQIPFVETWMRNSLESWFFVRPRTKEFLIGYPFLLIAIMYTDVKISKNWLWFFMLLATIAPISIINTFCHIHTPLSISLYRTFLGAFLGISVGMIYILLYTLSTYLTKRFSS